jgi:hypothetical protein
MVKVDFTLLFMILNFFKNDLLRQFGRSGIRAFGSSIGDSALGVRDLKWIQ